MDYLSDNDEVTGLMERYAEMRKKKPKLRTLKLKAKKPGLSQLLGDANPMKSDELEEIKKFIKLSR